MKSSQKESSFLAEMPLIPWKFVALYHRDTKIRMHSDERDYDVLLWSNQGGEEETLPESSQTFEVAAVWTSGLVVYLVVSHQTGFFECKHPVID